MSELSLHMIFSPQNCSIDVLEATLTPRRRVMATDILGRLKQACKKGPACRNLIIGPRGSGKTHVLSYIRRRLEQLCQANTSMVLIPLSEEERTVTRLLDFLIACLRALGVPLAEAMRRIRSVPPASAAGEALSIFHEHVAGRSALILVENFDTLLRGMGEHAVGELRAFLQNEPRVSLLASAISLFQDSNRADHPFYGFFLIEYLRPLDRRESREFLRLLAKTANNKELAAFMRQRQAKARVNAIHDLTAGNHRLLAMLSPFLAPDALKDLVGPFVQMVDRELTPYYQQKLDRLSPQQNAVVRAIVDLSSAGDRLGRPVGLGEIVDYTFLTSQHCSRLLFDLRYVGLVRTIKKGRESLYELNEPLLRLVLDMKEGHNRPLPLIVNILKLWYEAEELRDLAQTTAVCIRDYYAQAERLAKAEPREEAEVAAAFIPSEDISRDAASARITPEKDRHVVHAVGATEEKDDSSNQHTEVEDLIEKAIGTGDAGQHEEALRLFQKVLDLADGSVTDDQFARALLGESVALRKLGRNEETIAVCDTLVERFGGREELSLQRLVGETLLNRGATLGKLGHGDEAIATYDALVARFDQSEELTLQERVAKALVRKATTLRAIGRHEEAIAVCDATISRFRDRQEEDLQVRVAMALFNKGVSLGALGRSEEELALYDTLIERFAAREEPALKEGAARALVNKGVVLRALGRAGEAIVAYDTLIERFQNCEERVLQRQVAEALFKKGVALGALGRSEEAIAAYDTLLERFRTREEIAPAEQIGRALFNKGVRLCALGRSEEAIAVYDTLLERFGTRQELTFLEQIGRAMTNKGVTLGALGRDEEELATYDALLERFGAREEPCLLEQVAKALFNRGVRLGALGRREEELATYDALLERFGAREELDLLESVANALVNKGAGLGALGRSEQAIAVFDALLERFGARKESGLQEQVVKALFNKILVLSALNRHEEAFQVFDAALKKIPSNDANRLISVELAISVFCAKGDVLERAIGLAKQDEDALAGGLVAWLRAQVPMSKETAENLATCESVLKRSLADVPKCQPALQMLEAMRRDALGDKHALLELPLELRRLIEPEKQSGET